MSGRREITITISGVRQAGKTKLMQRLKQFLEFDGHEVKIDDGRLELFLDRQLQGPLGEPMWITMKEDTND